MVINVILPTHISCSVYLPPSGKFLFPKKLFCLDLSISCIYLDFLHHIFFLSSSFLFLLHTLLSFPI